jgi:rhamnogalacturonan endolyase
MEAIMKLKIQRAFFTVGFLSLALSLILLLPSRAHAAFGLTSDTTFFTVDTGGGLVFKVRRTDNGSSTQSAGDIASLFYNGVEYQNQSRGTQINGGFDYLYHGTTAVTVSASVIKTDYIKVTVQAGNLTHYYLARRGYPNIYMATHFTTEPDTLGLCRFIVRIPSAKLPNGPAPSDIRNTDTTIESGDIFGFSPTNANVALRGQTRSKHYSNQRLIDWDYIGATGPNVGVWMVRDNNEGGSSGPFYRSLLNQCGTDQEITYIINYGEAQTFSSRCVKWALRSGVH